MLLLISVALIKLLLPKSANVVNESINKEDQKVVDLVEIEDLDKEKISYCRCWRSKKVCRYKDILKQLHLQNCVFVFKNNCNKLMAYVSNLPLLDHTCDFSSALTMLVGQGVLIPCETKDEQTTEFSCSALALYVEWQGGHLAHNNLVVVAGSLSFV